MSKYQKLFSLSENLYAEGAPLIISAGALQKDTENGSVFAQIKLQNITQKKIKVVRAVFSLADAFDRIIGETEYVFQDFIAGRDEYFCQKQLVPVDNATRSFSAKVAEVAFSDGSKWNESDAEWKPIEKQQPISYLLKEQELIKQYHIKYGDACGCVAKTDRDLILCSCGTVNKAGENLCYNCRNNLSALLSLDIAALTAEKDARLANEAKEAEEKRIAAEERRVAEEKAAKRRKKAFCIGTPIVCACVAFVIVLTTVIIPSKKYNAAVELMTNEARAGFGSIIRYKDSKEYYKAIISRPQKAVWTYSYGYTDTYTCEYDSAGNLTKGVCTYSDGDTYTFTYEYDSAGNLTKEVCTDSYGNTYTYTYTYEYDSAGNLTKEVYTDSDGDTDTYTYEYDSAGNLTKEVWTYSDGDTDTCTYEYDSAGNLTKGVCTYSDGDTYTFTYEYDSAGNLTKEVCTDSYGNTYTYTYTYEYDSAGNMTKEVYTDSDGDTDTCTYEYDSAGNLTKEVWTYSDGDTCTYSDFIYFYNPKE